MIEELLPLGKKNAISSVDLVKASGVPNMRQLRAAVAAERKAGAVILSSSTGGYYRPLDRQEVIEFVKVLDSKSKSILVALVSAKRYLKRTADVASGQCRFDTDSTKI